MQQLITNLLTLELDDLKTAGSGGVAEPCCVLRELEFFVGRNTFFSVTQAWLTVKYVFISYISDSRFHPCSSTQRSQTKLLATAQTTRRLVC